MFTPLDNRPHIWYESEHRAGVDFSRPRWYSNLMEELPVITLNVRIPELDTAESGMAMALVAVVAFVVALVFWYVALALGY